MTEIRTLDQLQDALDREMSWRVKEIGAFTIASKANTPERKFFIRAGIALVYAHWEGFVKSSSEHYLNFINNQGHTYQELKSCFAIFGLKTKLQTLAVSRNAALNIATFDFVLSELGQPVHLHLASAVDTESNLSSKVFANIAASVDISTSSYETKFNLIDESLVSRRNRIAHGEYLDLGSREFGELTDEILQLMRDYKTDLQNAASTKSYKRTQN